MARPSLRLLFSATSEARCREVCLGFTADPDAFAVGDAGEGALARLTGRASVVGLRSIVVPLATEMLRPALRAGDHHSRHPERRLSVRRVTWMPGSECDLRSTG